jgi:serine/threonine protein kinase
VEDSDPERSGAAIERDDQVKVRRRATRGKGATNRGTPAEFSTPPTNSDDEHRSSATAAAGIVPGSPRIPGYQFQARIGQGGFSEVYRAFGEAQHQDVAVKVLFGLGDDGLRRRFLKEVDRTARFANHPNIITVLSHGTTESGQLYLVTAFYPGGSVSDRLESSGSFAVADALRVGVKMCGALETVHRDDIFHRDVKPQNIFLSEYGEAVLADFGIATLNRARETATETSVGYTIAHAPPEVLDRDPARAPADIYALGSTLFTLLAGHPPFLPRGDDPSLPELMTRVYEQAPPELTRDDLPAVLRDALRYALAKDPASRFQSAKDFGEYLQAAEVHLGRTPTEMVVGSHRVVTTAEPLPPPFVQPRDGPGAAEPGAETQDVPSGVRLPPVTDVPARTVHPTEPPDDHFGATEAPTHLPSTGQPTNSPEFRVERPVTTARRTIAIAIIALVGVVALGVGVFAFTRGDAETPTTGTLPPTAQPSNASTSAATCSRPTSPPTGTAPPWTPRITEITPAATSQVEVRWEFDGTMPGGFVRVQSCVPGQPIDADAPSTLAEPSAGAAKVAGPPGGGELCYFATFVPLAQTGDSRSGERSSALSCTTG